MAGGISGSILEGVMKTFVVACLAAIAIAIGAAVVLEHIQASAESAYSTAGARI
jgi:hypothetical protein